MSIKTNIKAAKVKIAMEKAKEAALDILGDVKGINVSMDFDNKKHTIEILTK